VLLAGFVGAWLGGQNRPAEPEKSAEVKKEQAPAPSAPESAAPKPRFEPPLYFYTTIQPGADLEAIAGEVKLAAAAGVHNFILRMPFPWPDQGADINALLYPLDRIEQEDPDAAIILSLSLNPTDAWFAANPGAAKATDPGNPVYPSIASRAWLDACKGGISNLLQQIENTGRGQRVAGLLLGALENDSWSHSRGYDAGEAITFSFREWLSVIYGGDDGLRQAWGDPEVSVANVQVPDMPDNENTENVFFAFPEEQRQVDYLRFLSESTADTISSLAAHVHQTSGRYFKLYVPYGHSFELLNNDCGHQALGLLLDGEIDGFVSPVSYDDRGLGGAGGFMGPVHSARYHTREWIVLDDTRTGISRNPESGAIDRLEGLRTEDVIRVHRRNYAAAMLNGLGLAWADMQGTGALYEPRMWESFRTMREAYDAAWNGPNAPAPGDFVTYPTLDEKLTLMVVLDERSRFYQRCDVKLNELLLRRTRDIALRVGVPTQFCLLQDVLDGHAAPAAAYLFLNTFHLNADDRERLKSILIANSAAAIWMYASGYLADTASADNIALTTGFKIAQFKGPARSGSTYQLSGGRFMKKGQEFGVQESWSPLFYADLPASKSLAKYRSSERTSVGIEFFEEGWASVFVGEPGITDDLLREILVILERFVIFRSRTTEHDDIAHFGPGLIAVHASTDGEHPIYFPEALDSKDVLDPSTGWLNKIYIPMPMRLGDTRILAVHPAISDELPEDIPDEVDAAK